MVKKDKRSLLKLIVNPAAGNSANTKSNLNAVTRYLEANGFKVNVARAKPRAKATPLARKAAKDGYKVVVAMGGDGTVEAVMRGLTGSKTRLGIVPTGVQNLIAHSLGIPLDLEQACRLISTENIREMDVAEVKKGKGKWVPFFEVVGVGDATSLMLSNSQEVKAGDALSRSGIAVAPVQDESVPRAILGLDEGRIMEVETRLLTVSNTPVFGKKYIVPPPEFLQDGLLDISVFQGFSEAELQSYYSQVKAGNYPRNENVRHYQSSRLKVRSTPRMNIVADGVNLGKGTVSLRMRPAALHVITTRNGRSSMQGPPHGMSEHPTVITSVIGGGDPGGIYG